MIRARAQALAPLVAVAVLVGLASGVAGTAVAVVLRAIQHAAYGYRTGTFLDGVTQAPPAVRIGALGLAGLIGGVGWWALRRWGRPQVTIDEAVAGTRMSASTTVSTVGLQVAVVGLGASIGREVAPRLLGALAAQRLTSRMPPGARRILVACGAGAGLAAVYNVPLGGALFTLETLLEDFTFPAVLAAVSTAGIATWVGRVVVPDAALYTMPAVGDTPSLLVWSLVAGPFLGLAGAAFSELTTAAGRRRPKGARLLVAMPVTFLLVGAAGTLLPQILGNGRALGEVAFATAAPAALLLLLALVKAIATGGTIASGAEGGTLTPSVAVGASLGAAGAAAWNHLWPGVPVAAGALVGAAAVLATTMEAPLTASVLVLEFAGAQAHLILPVVLGVAGAALVRLAGRRILPPNPHQDPGAG